MVSAESKVMLASKFSILIGLILLPPKVSVVIAAYNSSARLKCAVASVLNQSLLDLEVIVVGDCCTDDSEDVLASMDDKRIRWENLSRNWGEQSVPSNHGIELARGETVFFLNQDDLWMPNHVEECLTLFRDETIDVVWSPFVVLPPGFWPENGSLGELKLGGVGKLHPRFDPHVFIPASCTAWRAQSIRKLGGWRTAADVVVSPSQDLLWRAKHQRLTMRGTQEATVLVLWSGSRPGSYLPSFRAEDNEKWLRAIEAGPKSLQHKIRAIPRRNATTVVNWRKSLHRNTQPRAVIRRILAILGWHPLSFEAWLRNRASGGFINRIRALNGLSPIDFRHKKQWSERN